MSLFSKVWFQQHLGWKVFSNKWRHDSSLLVPLCATAQYRVSLTQLTDCAVSSNFGTPRLDTERPRQGHGVVVVSERSNFGKCILNNWTNLFVTWTNTNCNLDKFILMGKGYGVVVMSASSCFCLCEMGARNFEQSTNTFLNLEKYILLCAWECSRQGARVAALHIGAAGKAASLLVPLLLQLTSCQSGRFRTFWTHCYFFFKAANQLISLLYASLCWLTAVNGSHLKQILKQKKMYCNDPALGEHSA